MMLKTETPFYSSFIPLSTIDSPGRLSLVLFTDFNVCNLYCRSCHNRMNKSYSEFLSLDELISIIEYYKTLGVDLLIISGGEPLFNDSFIDFLKRYRNEISLPIRIDTNGTLPDKMLEVFDYVDGYAVDIKFPLKEEYSHNESELILSTLGYKVDSEDCNFDPVRKVLELRNLFYRSKEIAFKKKYSMLRLGMTYYFIKFGFDKDYLRKRLLVPVI